MGHLTSERWHEIDKYTIQESCRTWRVGTSMATESMMGRDLTNTCMPPTSNHHGSLLDTEVENSIDVYGLSIITRAELDAGQTRSVF